MTRKKHDYEVIVGNIGRVFKGSNRKQALKHFHGYKERSLKGRGRASGEPVTMTLDGEAWLNFLPPTEAEKRVVAWVRKNPAKCRQIVTLLSTRLFLNSDGQPLEADEPFMSGAEFIDQFTLIAESTGLLKSIYPNQ